MQKVYTNFTRNFHPLFLYYMSVKWHGQADSSRTFKELFSNNWHLVNFNTLGIKIGAWGTMQQIMQSNFLASGKTFRAPYLCFCAHASVLGKIVARMDPTNRNAMAELKKIRFFKLVAG